MLTGEYLHTHKCQSAIKPKYFINIKMSYIQYERTDEYLYPNTLNFSFVCAYNFTTTTVFNYQILSKND